MMKKLLSWIAALLLIGALTCISAFAAEQLPSETVILINPLYADVLNEDSITFRRGTLFQTASGYCETQEEMTDVIRAKLVSRSESFSVRYTGTEAKENSFFEDAFNNAMDHTGVPDEGDYIRWHYGGAELSRGGYIQDGVYYYTMNIRVNYYSTHAEELVVTQLVGEVLENLDIDGKSDYDKTRAIYGYICDHVTYDTVHADEYIQRQDDSTYEPYYPMFSAYAAINNGTAVCQGYAQLLYRMLLEAGIDCRLIGGNGTSGTPSNHAWNIVKIGNDYFNADSTWDAGNAPENYEYFLQTDTRFERGGRVHERFDDYAGETFYAAYPMGTGEPLKGFHSGACRIESVELLKDGRIGIVISIGAEAYASHPDAYMEIRKAGDLPAGGTEVLLSSLAEETYDDGQVIKSVAVLMPPKELKDSIFIRIYENSEGEESLNGKTPVRLYSSERTDVTDEGYRTTVYTALADLAETPDAPLAAALSDLGSCAQKVFGYHAEEASALTGGQDTVTVQKLTPFMQNAAGDLPDGLFYAGESLVLEGTTTVNLLFSGETDGVTFSLDGKPAEGSINGDYYVISIPGLTAGELGTPHVITASDGENVYTVSASALSYAYKALTEKTGTELQELVKCLYEWYALCSDACS